MPPFKGPKKRQAERKSVSPIFEKSNNKKAPKNKQKKSYEERFAEKIGDRGKKRLNSLIKEWLQKYDIDVLSYTKDYSKINEIRKLLKTNDKYFTEIGKTPQRYSIENELKGLIKHYSHYGIVKSILKFNLDIHTLMETRKIIEEFESDLLNSNIPKKDISRFYAKKISFLALGVSEVLYSRPNITQLQEIRKLLKNVDVKYKEYFLSVCVAKTLSFYRDISPEKLRLYSTEILNASKKTGCFYDISIDIEKDVRYTMQQQPSMILYAFEIYYDFPKFCFFRFPKFKLFYSGLNILLKSRPNLEKLKIYLNELKIMEERYLKEGDVDFEERNKQNFVEHLKKLTPFFRRADIYKKEVYQRYENLESIFNKITPVSFDLTFGEFLGIKQLSNLKKIGVIRRNRETIKYKLNCKEDKDVSADNFGFNLSNQSMFLEAGPSVGMLFRPSEVFIKVWDGVPNEFKPIIFFHELKEYLNSGNHKIARNFEIAYASKFLSPQKFKEYILFCQKNNAFRNDHQIK
jgi:hypothetical protein